MDLNIYNSASSDDFSRVILKFIRPEPNQEFNVESTKG